MNAVLQKHFNKLEADTNTFIAPMALVSEKSYFASPAEGKWSLSQIVTHLLVAEKMSLAYMQKKILGIDQIEDSGVSENIKFTVLKISQYLPLKYKAPKMLADNNSSLSLADASAEWRAVRAHLKEFLEGIPDKHIKRKIFKHPLVGMLNVSQAIQFMNAHLDHHLPQIKRLL